MKSRTQARLVVRRARLDDAAEAAAVLRASIADLCAVDHGNEPEILAKWLANKTPRHVRSWIESGGRVLVAEAGGRIVGVGAAVRDKISLNYVLPEARFRGVSKALLSALETELRAAGHTRITLLSTGTAYRFYRSAGYADAGEPQSHRGITCLPMSKDLATAAGEEDSGSGSG